MLEVFELGAVGVCWLPGKALGASQRHGRVTQLVSHGVILWAATAPTLTSVP